MEQLLALLNTSSAYFWATHAGAELDLLVMLRGKRYGFEFKHADAPGTTRSMHAATTDLGLEHLWVVYPGNESYQLGEKFSALAMCEIPALVARLK